MMKWILLILLTTLALAQDRVVIIDTGLDITDPRFSNLLCKDVQGFDFTGEGLNDTLGHGTHVAGIIKENAGNSDYCMTVIKYYSEDNTGDQNLNNLNKALQWIHYDRPALVNFSGGGKEWNDSEFSYIRDTPDTIFIVAVGNDGVNLDKHCDYYPACYKLDNIIRVGSLNQDGTRNTSSNYGNFNYNVEYEVGESILSTLPDNQIGYLSGTSMACAKKTGKIIYEKSHPSCPPTSKSDCR